MSKKERHRERTKKREKKNETNDTHTKKKDDDDFTKKKTKKTKKMGCAHSSPEQQHRGSASQRLFRQLFGTTTPYDDDDDDGSDDDDARTDGRRRRRGASSSSSSSRQDREQRQRRDDDVMKTKVVLLGDSGVGKSCIVNRFATNTFDIDSRVTVGAAFVARTIEVNDETRDGKERKVKFEIWDTAGQERYESLANLYYRRAHVALVVFALDDEKSFEKARFWINELKEKCERRDALIILCGNKMDKITDEHEDRIVENSSKNNFNGRTKIEKGNDGEIVEGKEEDDEEDEEEEETIFVTMDRAERMANELGCHMCVTSSAKTGEGVEELFFEVARKLLQREKGSRRKTDATNSEASKQKKTRNTSTSGARANAETAVVPPRTRDEEANNATKKKKKKKKKKTATTTDGESNPSRRPLHDT